MLKTGGFIHVTSSFSVFPIRLKGLSFREGRLP